MIDQAFNAAVGGVVGTGAGKLAEKNLSLVWTFIIGIVGYYVASRYIKLPRMRVRKK